MPAFADRVKETTTTTGTGTLTLDGAATGFQSFTTAFGNGVSVYYVIAGGSEWEIGIGTTGAGTLSRDTVLQSSNADALVSFSAGTKDVFCAYVADRAVTTVDAATLTNKTISGASNTLSNIGNAALTNSSVTVNGTAISLGSSGTVTAAAATLTGSTLASNVVSSSLTSLGTIASGIWQGTPVTDTYLATISTAGKVSNSATTAASASTASAIVARDANGSASFKNIKLDGTTSGTVTVQPAAAAGTWSLTLPVTTGTNGQVLTTDGTGVASWTTAGGGVSISESSTNALFYPVFFNATSGTATTLNTDSVLTWNPSSNTLSIGGTTSLQQQLEKVTITAAAPSGTIAYDCLTQAVQWYTSSATATWVPNFRGNSTTTLNSVMAVGQALTLVVMTTPTSASSYPTSVQIDGTTSGVTTRWQGAVVPNTSAGAITNATDVYSYTILKTANAVYTVFANVVNYAS